MPYTNTGLKMCVIGVYIYVYVVCTFANAHIIFVS